MTTHRKVPVERLGEPLVELNKIWNSRQVTEVQIESLEQVIPDSYHKFPKDSVRVLTGGVIHEGEQWYAQISITVDDGEILILLPFTYTEAQDVEVRESNWPITKTIKHLLETIKNHFA